MANVRVCTYMHTSAMYIHVYIYAKNDMCKYMYMFRLELHCVCV